MARVSREDSPTMSTVPDPLRVALLLSTSHFEDVLRRRSRSHPPRLPRGAIATIGPGTGVECSPPKELRPRSTWPRRVPASTSSPTTASACGFSLWTRSPRRGFGSRCSSARRSGRYVGQAANAAAMLRRCGSALLRWTVDVLCVQEYWTARLDLLVRAVEHAGRGDRPGPA